jgi:hypothetical protein
MWRRMDRQMANKCHIYNETKHLNQDKTFNCGRMSFLRTRRPRRQSMTRKPYRISLVLPAFASLLRLRDLAAALA